MRPLESRRVYETEHSGVLEETPEDCFCDKCDGVRIQVYGVVLLSLTIILMFIAICCLCYIIYRMRKNRYKEEIFSKDNIPITNEYVQQVSNETEPTAMKIIKFDSPFKSTNTLPIVEPDVKDKLKPAPKTLTKPSRPEFPKPANGGKLSMQPHVITPDQMSKVCVEVLEKMKRNQSTSLTDLNELMKHNDKEHNDQAKFEDNFEYDVLPRQEESGGEDVYDCPPMGNNHNDDDQQDYYDNLPIREDTYANVKFIHGIHSSHTAL